MTRRPAASPSTAARDAASPPVLENGACLTRCEFERRYVLRPDVKKAQLIEGTVQMPSPVSLDHAEPHAAIQSLLAVYGAYTSGVRAADNATVRLDETNEPQPDVLLRMEPEAGGGSRVSSDGYLEGSPELIVEIAASSASTDLHAKLQAYRRNGVQEYVVRRTEERRIDWLELAGGEYRPLPAGGDGVVRSRVFPGLRLAVSALLHGNLAEALAELHAGLASPERRQFVTRLAAARETGR